MRPLLFLLALVLCPILAVSLVRGKWTEFFPSVGALWTATRRTLTSSRYRPEYIREEARSTFFAFWHLVGLVAWLWMPPVRQGLGLVWVVCAAMLVCSRLPYSRRARMKSVFLCVVAAVITVLPALFWLKYRHGLWFVPLVYGLIVFLISFHAKLGNVFSSLIMDVEKGVKQVINYHD
jgi:hypothetical protein